MHALWGDANSEGAPDNFTWPPWCLDTKAPCIEVYVIDDDPASGIWVEASPQAKILDEQGRERYLHALYAWDEEEYVEDFGPRRVRRRGERVSVLDSWAVPPTVLGPQPAAGGSAALDAPLFPAAARAASAILPPAAAAGLRPPLEGGSDARDLAEVVLDCVFARGIACDALLAEHRSIVLRPELSDGSRLRAAVGRVHQPDFFERLVPQKELLTTISRAHFEMMWEAPAGMLSLRKLSRNSLLVNYIPISGTEVVPVPGGTLIGFNGLSDGDASFLVLKAKIRNRAAVEAEGSHAAVRLCNEQAQGIAIVAAAHPAPSSVAAVLECVRASGLNLSSIVAAARVIPLSLEVPVDIGRWHQPLVFEQLLSAEPCWMSYISRSHCRLRLQAQVLGSSGSGTPRSSSPLSLEVENLSANPILVSGRPLKQGEAVVVPEGSSIAFTAVVPGSGGKLEENLFLEFVVRRARVVG